jgi:hypothetical protein
VLSYGSRDLRVSDLQDERATGTEEQLIPAADSPGHRLRTRPGRWQTLNVMNGHLV